MDFVDDIMAKTHNIIVVFDGKAKKQDAGASCKPRHTYTHTYPREKIAAVSNWNKAEKIVFVYRWILYKYLPLPAPSRSAVLLLSWFFFYARAPVCVCVSVSITYVCQLSRFLRGLMVKSYYVQTTVNKYCYSGIERAWSGVNGYSHTDGTAAVPCSLTYWNCYVCVLRTCSLPLSRHLCSVHFVFRFTVICLWPTVRLWSIELYSRLVVLIPSWLPRHVDRSERYRQRKYHMCTVYSCFYYPIKVIAASGSIFLLQPVVPMIKVLYWWCFKYGL